MKYIYFISAATTYQGKKGPGPTYFHREEVSLPAPITEISQIEEVERYINQEFFQDGDVVVSVVFYHLLRTEEE